MTKKIVLTATQDNFVKEATQLETFLEECGCSPVLLNKILICNEEIFINIVNYAYVDHVGDVSVEMDVDEAGKEITVKYKDSGVPYNPLLKTDPDVTLSAEERNVGGLGIFMVKEMMDDVAYAYIDGFNVFSMKNKIK